MIVKKFKFVSSTRRVKYRGGANPLLDRRSPEAISECSETTFSRAGVL